jgi:hypothetical protein
MIESSVVITFRLIEFPAEEMSLGIDFSAFPPWMVWLYIILMASVAGITEEVGFRGYMQVPLEKRYGPKAAIVMVSILFMVLHINQAWAPFVLLHLFVIGAAWGILAHASGSLLPSIISHILADIFSFSYFWTDVAGTFKQQTIAETGIDAHFIVWIFLFAISVAFYVWTVRKTFLVRQKAESNLEVV